MALSPDGTRLYVTTYTPGSDTVPLQNHLSVYDTASGKLLERIVNPDAIKHTMVAYATTLAVSAILDAGCIWRSSISIQIRAITGI